MDASASTRPRWSGTTGATLVRAYWRQQSGYGKAEALLERKWPEKYNAAGHRTWSGRLYGNGLPAAACGGAGASTTASGAPAPSSRSTGRPAGTLASLPLMPEWILVVLALAALSLLGLVWTPLLVVGVPLFALAAAFVPLEALLAARRAAFPHHRAGAAKRRALTALLNVLQPLARLRGRLDHGLTPWRRRGRAGVAVPVARTLTVWSEHWLGPEERLEIMEHGLRGDGLAPELGGEFDRWDLEVRGGFFGCARLRLAVEEHGGGRQLVRFRVWPRIVQAGVVLFVLVAASAVVAGLDGDAALRRYSAGALALLVLEVDGASRATAALRLAVARQQALADYDLAADLQRRARAASLGEVEVAEEPRHGCTSGDRAGTPAQAASETRSFWPQILGVFVLSLLATPLALLLPLPLKIAVDSVLGSQPLPGLLDAIVPSFARTRTHGSSSWSRCSWS